MQLTSAKNPQLQAVRRAAASGRPTDSGFLVAEGPHLVEEALFRSRWQVEHIYVSEAGFHRHAGLLRRSETEITEVSEAAFAATISTETSQGILALVRPRTFGWPDLLREPAAIVILDAIQDPGNAGAIVRSAEAFGASGVILLSGSTRVSNPKFLRATAGSIFRLAYLEQMRAGEVIRIASENRIRLFTLAQDASKKINEVDFRSAYALIAGNEAAGVSGEIATTSECVSIPVVEVESLNAAIACSIALYEAARQRRGV